MRNILFAAVTALAVTTAGFASAQPLPAPPDPVRGSSAAALKDLITEWRSIGFNAPSKPMQYRVYGRDGHVTDGPGYNVMVSLIRSAAEASRAGRDEEAFAKIARVKRLLGS